MSPTRAKPGTQEMTSGPAGDDARGGGFRGARDWCCGGCACRKAGGADHREVLASPSGHCRQRSVRPLMNIRLGLVPLATNENTPPTIRSSTRWTACCDRGLGGPPPTGSRPRVEEVLPGQSRPRLGPRVLRSSIPLLLDRPASHRRAILRRRHAVATFDCVRTEDNGDRAHRAIAVQTASLGPKFDALRAVEATPMEGEPKRSAEVRRPASSGRSSSPATADGCGGSAAVSAVASAQRRSAMYSSRNADGWRSNHSLFSKPPAAVSTCSAAASTPR